MTSERRRVRRVMKKFSITKQNLHRKFIARFMRLDFPRKAYITRLLDVIYLTQRNHQHSYREFIKEPGRLENILDNLHAEIGGQCAYQPYDPEIIERENDNLLIYQFLTLTSPEAKLIISITEYLVKLFIESGVKKTVWESIILELKDTEQLILNTA